MGDLLDGRQCTARSKRSGERCRRAAVLGGTVCSMHGGKAPQVAAAAEGRVIAAAADEAVRRLWVGLDDAPPVKDPVASMERMAGALQQLVDEAGSRVSDLQHVAGGKDLTQLRAEVVLFERALGHLRGLLNDMAKLGIAEKHIELQQAQAEIVVAAVRLMLDDLGLVPADRDRGLRVFLKALGRSPETVQGAIA